MNLLVPSIQPIYLYILSIIRILCVCSDCNLTQPRTTCIADNNCVTITVVCDSTHYALASQEMRLTHLCRYYFFSFHLVRNVRVPKNEANVLMGIFPLLGN